LDEKEKKRNKVTEREREKERKREIRDLPLDQKLKMSQQCPTRIKFVEYVLMR
jgi:hypothetical protein